TPSQSNGPTPVSSISSSTSPKFAVTSTGPMPSVDTTQLSAFEGSSAGVSVGVGVGEVTPGVVGATDVDADVSGTAGTSDVHEASALAARTTAAVTAAARRARGCVMLPPGSHVGDSFRAYAAKNT